MWYLATGLIAVETNRAFEVLVIIIIRAEWIRREQERKVSHMGWMPIQITEITSYCLKLTIGNLLDMIKYKLLA